MSRGIGRRKAALLSILVATLLSGVVLAESLNGSLQGVAPPVSAQAVSSYSGNPALLENLTQFVNPFIGTGDSPSPCAGACGGDTFPGAAYPLGMVQWSPDTTSNPPGGYYYGDSVIKDFSLTHFSGRGCQVYQDFPFMPYVGQLTSSPAANASGYYSSFSHAEESARPGYYSVHLDGPNVTVELSVTLHTGVGRFVFPASSHSTVLINAAGSVNGNPNSAVSILPSKSEVTGFAESVVGCGNEHYQVYFAARFDRSFTSYGTWNGALLSPGSGSSSGQHDGAFLVFDTTSDRSVDVQVGISFVSVANAQLNLDAENANFDLEAVAKSAANAWNERLNSILATGGTPNETVTLYTALYHVFFHPNVFSDANGQYLGFDGKVHTVASGHAQYENIPGWDAYRTHIELLAILAPNAMSDIAQSLVNDAQQGGGSLPRWEQANVDSHGMSGDGGDVMIAEAYAFGATNFDAPAALSAMVNGQANEREGYAGYVRLGYVPADAYRGYPTASMTLEYSTDDFAISQFASALGNSAVAGQYLQRSANWLNLFNATSGYVQPRNSDGTWAPGFDPTTQNGFQEGDSAQYTWMVPFNLAGLFAQMGGNSTAVGRLELALSSLDSGPDSLSVWMGNEVCTEVPWEFDFAQAPAQTQSAVRQIETKLWSNAPGGMPGNDDGGELSSWYIFAAIGIYPEIPGWGGFVIGSPLFSSVTVALSGGNALKIEATGASPSHPYVQSLELNGASTNSLWIPWSGVKDGATLNFTLGQSPSSWASNPQDAPPSFAP